MPDAGPPAGAPPGASSRHAALHPGPSPGLRTPLLVFAAALAAYVLTLLPGVGYGGDAAKFQFLGRVLGIGHPTGYPVYLLLNAAFGLLPFAELAFRINLLSALLGAAAAAALVPALRRAGAGALAPAGALLFAFSYTEWSQAVIAEVYTMHSLLLALCLCALLDWGSRRRDASLVAFLLLLGLSFAHHLLMVTAVPGFLLYILLVDRRALLRRGPLLGAAGGALLGLLPYAYLPWRTAAGAAYLEAKVRSLGDLVNFVTGAAFRAEMALGGSGADWTARLPELAQHVALEWTPAGWLLVPLGAVRLARRLPREAALLGLVATGDLLFTASYDIPDYFVYLLPLHLAAAFAAVHGLLALGDAVRAWTGAADLRFPMTAAALLAAAGLAAVNGPLLDRSGDTEEAARTRAILDAAGEPAVLLAAQYDLANYLRYYLLVDPRYRGREVYVAEHLTWEELAAYLRGEGRLRQVESGPPAGVAPGPPAYAVVGAEQYQAAGFRLTPVAGARAPVFRVDLPAPPGPERAGGT